MSNKVRKNVTLYESNINYVNKIKIEKGFKSQSQALDYIVSEHKKINDSKSDVFVDKIIKGLKDEYENTFTRIRLGVNNADRNSQIMIEILNSMLVNLGIEQAYDTEILEADVLKESREIIKKRIARYKQIKDNKAKK